MDILYVLGKDSEWDNNEIRFSLRSVAKHLSKVHNVFIVGECPPFLKNVVHIPFGDLGQIAWQNSYAKIMAGCLSSDIAADFLLFNDDFYILQNFRADQFPVYHRGALKPIIRIPEKAGSCIHSNTYYLVKKYRENPLDFMLHCPLPINKKNFLEMPNLLNYSGQISTRCFYGNFCQLDGAPAADFFAPTDQNPFFSSDTGLEREKSFRDWLKKRFPKPSKYEKTKSPH